MTWFLSQKVVKITKKQKKESFLTGTLKRPVMDIFISFRFVRSFNAIVFNHGQGQTDLD